MSGLLHRLAARAIGVAPTVRPVAATMGIPPREDREAPPVSAALDSVEPRMERREIVGRRGQPEHDAEPIAGRVAPDRVRTALAGATVPPSSHTESAAQLVPIATVGDVPPAEPSSGAGEAATNESATPLRQTPQRGRERATPATREVRAHHIEYRTPSGVMGHEPDVPTASDPPCLFANPSREAGLARSALAATRTHGPAGMPAVEETTEVHVSIGRIEVTAIHEAPPPKREPARSRKARSLDEYLASRQERRS